MSIVDTEFDEEKKAAQLVEYLQGPRKKRKNYIILATNRNFDPDLLASIQGYIRKNHAQLSLAIPKNEKEFNRLSSRQIVLTMVDDQFMPLPELMQYIKQLKEKKQENAMPILFFTENVKALIAAYHKELLPFQEVDNYLSYRSMPLGQVFARIQSALNQKNARRSKRFHFHIPITYLQLRNDSYCQGHIIEMSVHGGIIHSAKDAIFQEREQLKIHLPIRGILAPIHGEFMRLAARIRRVLMGGSKAAVSWEYLSPEQQTRLTAYILELVNMQVLRGQHRKSK